MAKVIFIQDIAYEYFGVMYLSSYLKQYQHQCDVLIENLDKDIIGSLKISQPDLVCFSVLTGSLNWAINIASKIKEEINKPVVFGGVHVFLNPHSSIEHDPVDAICTGEGEIPLLELCNSIDLGGMDFSIKGMWFKKDGQVIKNLPSKLINDLDSLPFADRSIYWKYPEIVKRRMFPILGSRGCPYTCTYCFIPSAKEIFEGQGKFIRERSAENILEEIRECIRISPRKRQVHFVEDHFGNNRQRTLAVLKEMRKMRNGTMQWTGAIRVERFNKESYAQELSKTNPGLLGIAVECGNEQYRKDVLKRDVKNTEIINTADLCNKFNIKFVTLNMVGLPGETYEMALETLDLNIKMKPVFANCYIYQPYPGTKLQQYSVEHMLMEEKVVNNLGLSFYDRYSNDKTLNKIANLQRVFSLIVTVPSLKKPLLKLVDWNLKLLLDGLFGLYYVYYLWHFYSLTALQIINLAVLWIKRTVSLKRKESYITASIRSGEAQLYPEVK